MKKKTNNNNNNNNNNDKLIGLYVRSVYLIILFYLNHIFKHM
jgi:hypothetical protein